MINNHLPTITIGIPAFNEEANIKHLLLDLKKQKQKGYLIDRIIISSDGSTDNTVNIIKAFKDNRITIIDNKVRKGASVRQNQLMEISNSEIFVLLNADIMITDKFLISKLVAPIRDQDKDLTAVATKELRPKSFFEQVLFVSMMIKHSVFETYRSGNNIYTCHGAARALSKKLYKKLEFKDSIGEDAYTYFYCVYNKFKYTFVKNTGVYYRLPNNFLDHEKQSIRFLQSQKKFIKQFGEEFVLREYHLPLYLIFYCSFYYLFRYPIHSSIYFLIYIGIKIKAAFRPTMKDTWDISKSSKILRVT